MNPHDPRGHKILSLACLPISTPRRYLNINTNYCIIYLMAADKYTAVWVSHTSMGDFISCPRAYFLKNIYRDPKTGHKIKLMSPPLALGQAVHDTLEIISFLPTAKRFDEPLIEKFEGSWKKVSGKRGGFSSFELENKYKEKGRKMIQRMINHPGPLSKLAVKLNMNLPYFWLSEKENIILCGKIDWLEYLPDTDRIHIIDFKTGKSEEDSESLQLPIYYLLAENCQQRKVSKASYWYLERSDLPVEKGLPDLKKARETIFKIARRIKLARQLEIFRCPHKNGCRFCRPFEAVVKGEAELVGVDEYGSDVYILEQPNLTKGSVIL